MDKKIICCDERMTFLVKSSEHDDKYSFSLYFCPFCGNILKKSTDGNITLELSLYNELKIVKNGRYSSQELM